MVFAETASGLEEHWYATLRNHGRVRGGTILENGSDAGHDFQTLSNVGIDVDAITESFRPMGSILTSAYDCVLAASGKEREKTLATRATA